MSTSTTTPTGTEEARHAVVVSVLSGMMSVGRRMRTRLPEDALDPGSMWLLKTLSHDGDLRIRDLAARVSLDASTVSRHVSQLRDRGLIDRTLDPEDGRAQLISLSDEGRRVLTDAMHRRRDLLAGALTTWSDEDLAQFDHLLHRFADDVEALSASEENR